MFSVAAAAGSIVNYSISISLNAGPLAGQTGFGTMSLDTSLAQTGGGFTFVEPGAGLLSLQMTLLGTSLTSTGAVNYPILPVIFLDNATLSPVGIWSAWGSTTAAPAPAFLFLNFGYLEYDTLMDSLDTFRTGASSEILAHTDSGNQQTTGIVTITAVPEPSTASLVMGVALVVLGVRRRLS